MQKNHHRILIVDDNKMNLRILAATFEDSGFTVHTASSVLDAQKILESNVVGVELVLSDIQMPGLTGFDLVEWMKSDASLVKDLPILLITSQLPESENRIRGLSLGAVDYLVRSLDPQELVLRVSHAIESFDQIRRLRGSLETTETLAATGRLFAASNHEIKNVSQFIKLGTAILARELGPLHDQMSKSSQQALKMLVHSSDLLSNITRMIGGIVSDGDAHLTSVDLNMLLADVLAMVRPILKCDIDIVYTPQSIPPVFASSTFLQQVLINLILNARDAIVEKKSDVAGEIAIAVDTSDPGFVVLSVRDNGVGFPAQETRTVFLPFASTKQMRGGTGLGLWLSSHLLQKMGASLSLASDGPGTGAVARMVLKSGGS